MKSLWEKEELGVVFWLIIPSIDMVEWGYLSAIQDAAFSRRTTIKNKMDPAISKTEQENGYFAEPLIDRGLTQRLSALIFSR